MECSIPFEAPARQRTIFAGNLFTFLVMEEPIFRKMYNYETPYLPFFCSRIKIKTVLFCILLA